MSIRSTPRLATPALVSRPTPGRDDPGLYLSLTAEGAARWTDDAEAAMRFESMREATRAALRLPSSLRAFSVPRGGEMLARASH